MVWPKAPTVGCHSSKFLSFRLAPFRKSFLTGLVRNLFPRGFPTRGACPDLFGACGNDTKNKHSNNGCPAVSATGSLFAVFIFKRSDFYNSAVKEPHRIPDQRLRYNFFFEIISIVLCFFCCERHDF